MFSWHSSVVFLVNAMANRSKKGLASWTLNISLRRKCWWTSPMLDWWQDANCGVPVRFIFLRFSWRIWQLTMASFRHNQILRISVRSYECCSCVPITPVLKSFSRQCLQQQVFFLFCFLFPFVYVFEFLSSIKTRSHSVEINDWMAKRDILSCVLMKRNTSASRKAMVRILYFVFRLSGRVKKASNKYLFFFPRERKHQKGRRNHSVTLSNTTGWNKWMLSDRNQVSRSMDLLRIGSNDSCG